jgi:hypothetical protein
MDTWKTRDSSLIACLLLYGYKEVNITVSKEDGKSRVYYEFENTPELSKVLQEWYAGSQLKQYAETKERVVNQIKALISGEAV